MYKSINKKLIRNQKGITQIKENIAYEDTPCLDKEKSSNGGKESYIKADLHKNNI